MNRYTAEAAAVGAVWRATWIALDAFRVPGQVVVYCGRISCEHRAALVAFERTPNAVDGPAARGTVELFELFELYGFSRRRQVGKHAWVVSKQIDPA